MISTYTTSLGDYSLEMETDDRSLQPWDAADEYLLNTLGKDLPKNIFIINDRFGALTVPLSQRTSVLISDSLVEIENTEHNLKVNGISPVRYSSTLGDTHSAPDLILMRIPKSLEHFRLQLEVLSKCIDKPVDILAGGMSRYLPESFFTCFQEMTVDSMYSRIIKKARNYRGVLHPFSEKSGMTNHESSLSSYSWEGRTYLCYPGVFSRGKLDRGSRFLLENFPGLPAPEKIIDPGCGSGILGLEALFKWPEATLTATDENALAVASTELNARRLGLMDRCKVVQTRILRGVTEGSADLAVCNPPFHRGHTVSMETGFAFIREISGALRPEGNALIVVNRSLGYGNILKENFSRTAVLKQNREYTLLLCRK